MDVKVSRFELAQVEYGRMLAEAGRRVHSEVSALPPEQFEVLAMDLPESPPAFAPAQPA